MKHLPALFLCLAFALAARAESPATTPDQRDRDVLQTLMLHLLTDSQFNFVRPSAKGTNVVLHLRTPEKTGFLLSGQLRSDTATNILSTDLEASLRQRNTPPDAFTNSDIAVTAYYTNLTFTNAITIADIASLSDRPLSYGAFEKAYPHSQCWFEPYLPGFSTAGHSAIIRAFVGPTPHGATVTALLEKRGDQWIIKWCKLARYV
jgi:hypothetical protein